jgi:hypothetical protein
VRVTFATSAANIEGLEPVDDAVLKVEVETKVVDEIAVTVVVEAHLVVDDFRIVELEGPVVAQLAP